MSPRPTFKQVFNWVADLGVRCMHCVSIERTARLSPDWGRLESKTPNGHHK
ncbi:MAG: hypothetical protein M3Z41_04035 [Candidatus Eremiobacteraeota bacterium]|nr:hypothetical protein [Candidatus Eremiobacteraeota bacterium]